MSFSLRCLKINNPTEDLPGKRAIGAAVLACAVFLTLSSCGRPESDYRKSAGSIWNTTYHITYNSAKELDDSITEVLQEVGNSLSPFQEGSLISRINNGERIKPDSMFCKVFAASQQINHLSGGAFDPTVAPLVNLWGFGWEQANAAPTKEQIDSALSYVGIAQCGIEEGYLRKKHPETSFNFSAIAKGFGGDMVAEMFLRNNCNDFMIEIGGDIVLSGKNAKKEPWHIMIDAPIENDSTPEHQCMAIIEISNCGIATSGNYRNFHSTGEGEKVWHTISPSTGYPVVSSTLSATVIAPSAMLADALATSCMAMEADSAIAMIEKIPEASALLVTADDDKKDWQIRTSSRFPEMH